jgi:hypothetical protein
VPLGQQCLDLGDDIDLIPRTANRSMVLNRLSHSGTPLLTSGEVKMALARMQRLQHHRFKKSNCPAA